MSTMIWGHMRRNRAIALVATSTIRDIDITCPKWLSEVLRDTGGDDWTALMTVLVDSAAHSYFLHGTVEGKATPWPGPETQRKEIADFCENAVFATDNKELVIVVATAGASIPEIPDDLLDRSISIIDFADDFDVQAESETLSRMQQYIARGYIVEGKSKWVKPLRSA